MMRSKWWGVLCAVFVCLALSACSQQAVKDEDGDAPAKASVSKEKSKSSQANKNKNQQIAKKQTTFTMPKSSGKMPQLSPSELRLIADKIFRNEGGGNLNNLVHWNDGEDFASMGIGHFTWYPVGRRARFGNTFPELLGYMQQNGVQLPTWLHQARYQGAPWNSKTELMYAKQGGQVRELQNLLYQTRLLQAAYIVERTRRAIPQLVNTAPAHSRSRVAQNLNSVANTPGGWYVLVDYINFKGEGLNINGGYRGQNWGLLQVLEEMQPTPPGQQALHSFADAATRVLVRRVRNSPPARNEARWLAGWSNRINTYRYPGV